MPNTRVEKNVVLVSLKLILNKVEKDRVKDLCQRIGTLISASFKQEERPVFELTAESGEATVVDIETEEENKDGSSQNYLH